MKRLFGRHRQVADDNGMLPVAKKEQPRSSRRIGDGFFQRMRDLVRPIRVAPSPVIKQEPSRRSRTSKDILFDDNTHYSPVVLELPHSTSRNRTSKRFPLQDITGQEEIEGVRNILNILDSSSKSLNHLTLIKYLNGLFHLSGITEIKLYGKDLLKINKEEIIRLLKSTLQQSNNIETIEIDVPYLIPVILELGTYKDKLSTIKRLILRSDYESPKPISDDVIFNLLSMIERMTNLNELEFSQFEIDVSNFKGGLTFNDLFRRIVVLKNLQQITFNANVFTDTVKEDEFYNFYEKYYSKDGVRRTNLDRIRILVEWIINNLTLKISGVNAYNAYISSNFWNNYLKQKKEGTKNPDLPKISDVSFDDFLKDEEAVKKWLIWLIINKGYIKSIGDIVERLRIVIKYFENNIDSIVNFFAKNLELQNIIISEFNGIVASTYKPRPNDKYNRILTEIIGNKLVKSRGGRKAPKKMPKQPTKAPKKTSKQPTKPTKQPTKPTTVSRKANKYK